MTLIALALLPLRCAKPDGVGAVSQRLIARGEQSGLWTRTRTMESVFIVKADEKLTAFVELESVV
jgi:hypothetical protein